MSRFFIAESKPTLELRTAAYLCEEEAIFSASSEARERQFKASKLHNSMLSIFFTKSKIMFLFFEDVDCQRHKRAFF